MSWYNDLRPDSDENKVGYALLFPGLTNPDKKRCINSLLLLRENLKNQIPTKKTDKNLLLATWNIKEFGHYTERLPESYFYITEILQCFDLIAVQEVKSTLHDLNIVMRLLGSNWGYVITDVTEGTKGNKERFAYIYDKRRVQPSGLSGEIVLWDDITKNSSIKQLKRTPAITGFTSGWKSFAIINVHLHPGNDKDDEIYRQEEVQLLMEAIKEKQKKGHFWNENLVLLGDTNLYSDNTETVQTILDTGFKESEGLVGIETNVSQTEIYDRIFYTANNYFQIAQKEGKESGGVFKFYDYIYTEQNRQVYHDIMKIHKDNPATLTTDAKFKTYFHRYWKRNQISDHYPVWLEMQIDSSDNFLKNKLEEIG